MKGSGVAIQINEEVLKSLSTEHNLPIAKETYQDLGKSAYKGEHLHNELGLFLSAVKSRTVAEGSILVVYSLDRLSRLEIGHAKQTYYDLTNNGVSVYAVVDNHLYRAHNAADDIIATITFERAHNESKNKSRRVIDAAKQGLKRWKETGEPQGSLGRTPFWIDQNTNAFNVNAEGARKAIEMKLAGYGDLRIKQHLDAHYEYKPTRSEKQGKKNSWCLSSINKLWHKRSLIGEKKHTIEGHPHVFENYYPALVDTNTFQQLAIHCKKKEGRSTATGRIPLLKGISRCGVCNGAMVTGEKKTVRYFCNQASKSEHDREIYNADVLEILTMYICRDAYLIEDINDNDLEHKRLQLETDLSEQRTSLESLRERYKKKPNNTYFDLIEDSEDKIAALEEELAALNTDSVEFTEDELSGLSEIFCDEVLADHCNPKRLEIKKTLGRFISSIVFCRNRLPCNHSKTGFAECIDITWNFKNGQKRRLAMLPFEYINSSDGGRELFLPFIYTYGCNSPMKVNRDRRLIYTAIERLHSHNLASYLYPSRGRYQWEGLSLMQGEPFWAPLDSAWFREGAASFFADKSTTSDISLLLNYQPNTGDIHDQPDILVDNLSSIFEFTESTDLRKILSEELLDQEPNMVFEQELSWDFDYDSLLS